MTLRRVGLYCALISLSAIGALAQQSATVSGVVSDSSAAVVPGAEIRLVHSETGETYSAVSNEAGSYTIPFVKPGTYELQAESAGFKQYKQAGIVLDTAAAVRADVTLTLGDVTEIVTVEADIPLLKTENSSVGTVVNNKTIANMPLAGRRAAQLARLSGFIVQNGDGSNFTMAGGRGDNSMWTIDGGSAQNILLGVATLTFDPPIEALEEFNVEVSNYKAEMGRTGGGFVQMTTRSGTNQFHGAAYEFLRNDAMDARQFFSARKPVLRRNQFGYAIGGPIKKDRTFFFFNQEFTRQSSQIVRIMNIPNPLELTGDFSQLYSAPTVRDPFNSRALLPNNTIPQSQLDPVGRELVKFYPTPNVANAASRNRNYVVNEGRRNPAQAIVTRIDHTINDRLRLYGRYLHNLASSDEGNGVWPTPVSQFNQNVENSYFNWSVTGIANLTNTLVMESRYTWNRRKFHPLLEVFGEGFPERLGLKGVDPDYFPQITFTGGIEPIGKGGQQRKQFPILDSHIMTNFTKVAGNHTFKWGWEFRSSRNDDENFPTAGGTFGFNSNATGDSVAALLYGWAASAGRQQTLLLRSRAMTMGQYFQTDWRINQKLTLNLGIRYDLDFPRWEAVDNRQNSFDRDAINPACNCPGVVTWSGRTARGGSKYAHNFDKNNFGPRVGFAYRPTDKWVIRGGGSVVYIGQYDQATPTALNAGFSINSSFTPPDNAGRTAPALLLKDGLPAQVIPTDADLTPSFGAVAIGRPTVFAPQFLETEGRPVPYLITYNFNVQRQLPGNMLFEVGYLSTLGHKLLQPNNLPINQIHPSQIQWVDTVPSQTLRPFPQFSNVNLFLPTIGNSNYHGMNLKVEKRYSDGLQFSANYTWSKAIDDVESRNELGGEQGDPFANIYDLQMNRALSGAHIAHRFIISPVWEIPWGKGRAHSFQNGVLNQIAGGWTLGTILEMRTGSPFGAIFGNAGAVYPTAAKVRAKALGDYEENGNWRDNVIGEKFFNTASFVRPDRFTFGNVGRNIGISPGAVRADLSVIKEIYMPWEGHSLQFRGEALNFINRANFAVPNQDVNAANFGTITSLIGGNQARIMQLGLRYSF